MSEFTTKLGKTRAGDHSRIWIEGQRLIAAGFIQGAKFEKDFDPMYRTLYLHLSTLAQFEQGPRSIYGTVSGKDGKPIIDIVGAQVIECFRGSTHVTVSYERGTITIRSAA